MLTASFDKNSEKLNVQFDLSIPLSFENNGDLRFLMSKLKEIAKVDFYRENNGLKGFSVHLPGWIRFIENIMSPEGFLFQKSILDDLMKQETKEQGNGLEINFHQNPFDTPARYWGFILNQGHFVDYFVNRIN